MFYLVLNIPLSRFTMYKHQRWYLQLIYPTNETTALKNTFNWALGKGNYNTHRKKRTLKLSMKSIADTFNPLYTTGPFLYLLNTSERQRFSSGIEKDRQHEMGQAGWSRFHAYLFLKSPIFGCQDRQAHQFLVASHSHIHLNETFSFKPIPSRKTEFCKGWFCEIFCLFFLPQWMSIVFPFL